jgi:hypothetical protein
MKKIIKLSDNHYIVVDDSEMKVGDLNIPSDCSKIADISTTAEEDLEIVNRRGNGYLKITHSTQPLEEMNHGNYKSKVFLDIKPLSLSEVEELISGYNVEKMAEKRWGNRLATKGHRIGFVDGFNAHKELVKDKLFTAQDVINIVKKSRETGLTAEYFITKHLLPKTEWECTIDEQNKITIL